MALRKQCREIRCQIKGPARETAACSAATLLSKHPIYQNSRYVACYQAMNSEFDSQAMIDMIWQDEKLCYLPVITEGKSLEFIHYQKGDELQKNKLSIYEPVNSQHKIQPEKIDLVICPLIAFDRNGNRLGTGGGYYDRAFAFLHELDKQTPKLYGLGYDAQEVDEIESEQWDVKLNGIITETRIIDF